jgi:hypothetical protein
MRKLFLAAAMAVLSASLPVAVSAQAPAAGVSVNPGKMLYSSNGQRVGAVYRVNAEGDPQIILSGKLVTIPASTLSEVEGKLTTSLARKDIGRAK